jgi:nucleoid-associated protein YgaU
VTKETKIGLLVGLAFIILFAIILSEKGTPQRSANLPTFTVADGAKSAAPSPASDQPLGGAGRLSVATSQLPPIVQPRPQKIATAPPSPVVMTEERVAQSTPKKDDFPGTLPESVVNFLNTMPIKSEPAALQEPSHLEPGPVHQPPISIPPTVASSTKVEHGKAEHAASTTSLTKGIEIPNSLTTSKEPPKPATDHPVVIKTVHTVQSGESLGKIAAKYYGRSTPARVDAIYKANRDRLKDSHQVKVEQKLDIPDLGEANSQFEPVPVMALTNPIAIKTTPPASDVIRIPIPVHEKTASAEPALKKLTHDAKPAGNQLASASSSSKKSKPAEASYQWYEVRPKDTLSKIARQQLGSEKHCSELYQLNKDMLGKKNILKPGMKLKIPMKSAATIEPQTAVSATDFGSAD